MNKSDYLYFINHIKSSILHSRYQAARLANRELVLLYFRVGKLLSEKIKAEKWGAKVLQQISTDLQNELPGLRGFSRRNLYNMQQFYEFYPFLEIVQSVTAQNTLSEFRIVQSITSQLENSNDEKSQSSTGQIEIVQPATAQIGKHPFKTPPESVLSERFLTDFLGISFTHHILLINKLKSWEELLFYMQASIQHQWSVSLLEHQITSGLYKQKGKLQSNFEASLPKKLFLTAIAAFRDEYLLDYLRLDEEVDEREFESSIVNNIRQFILSLGSEFSFIGNQYRLIVEEDEFFVDLLFFNRKLQSLVAIDLKRGKFKPEYAGKMNFYLNALNDLVRLPHENPSIGIILCKEKKSIQVEYSIRNIEQPLGIATYQLTKELPEFYKNHLPDPESLIKQIENEG